MRGRIALQSTSSEMHRTSVVFRPAASRTFGVCTRPRVAFDGSEVLVIAGFERPKKLDTDNADHVETSLITSSDVSAHSSAELKSPRALKLAEIAA
jgi:hypothetical protein